MKILVYLIQADSAYRKKRSIQKGKTELSQHIAKCNQYLGKYKKDMANNGNLQAIVVAPEYYFSGFDASGNRDGISLTERDQLHVDLIQISKQNQGLMIIPGSIFYRDSISDMNKKRDIFEKTVVSEMNMKLKKADPRLFDYDPNKPGRTVIHELGSLDKDAVIDPCFNECLLLLNGKHKLYGKKTGFNEARGKDVSQTFFVPHVGKSTYTFEGYKFGMEICFDHNNGTLKNILGTDGGGVDFHVVVSDWVDTNTANIKIEKGGYFLHASTNKKMTKVYKKEPSGNIKKVDSKKKDSSHKLYMIDVEDKISDVEVPKSGSSALGIGAFDVGGARARLKNVT